MAKLLVWHTHRDSSPWSVTQTGGWERRAGCGGWTKRGEDGRGEERGERGKGEKRVHLSPHSTTPWVSHCSICSEEREREARMQTQTNRLRGGKRGIRR